jgi:addiction module HigA family antidote
MMHNPPHPGELLLEECIKPLGLSVTAAADALKVSRVTLSEIVNGRSGISADMAVKISRVFGSTPDFWMRLQDIYELWQAQKNLKSWKPKVSFVPAAV